MIRIAHAVYDENGKACNGKPGDQTGKEVTVWDWYKSGNGWTHVFRCKDAKKAKNIAAVALAAAKNPNIGYSQSDRLGLYNASKNCYVSQVKTPCNTDCSGLVAVCLIKSGIKVSPSMYTGNELAVIKATKMFDVLTDTKYLTNTKYLKPGDIIMRVGHTAVIVDQYTVKDLQTALNRLGYDLSVDGVKGPKTISALADFKIKASEINNIAKYV